MNTAVIALVGTLLSAAVSFAGLVIKRQGDARNGLLKSQEQDRLSLDQVITATKLLTLEDGTPADRTMTAAALLLLVHLDQSSLMISLMSQLWPADRVATENVVRIFDVVFRSVDQGAKEEAAWLMAENVDKLRERGEAGEYYWPPSISNGRWLYDLPLEAVSTLVLTWIRMWLASADQPSAYSMFGLVYTIWKKAGDPVVRNSAGRVLSIFCHRLPSLFPMTSYEDQLGPRSVRLEVLQQDLADNSSPEPVVGAVWSELDNLEVWASQIAAAS